MCHEGAEKESLDGYNDMLPGITCQAVSFSPVYCHGSGCIKLVELPLITGKSAVKSGFCVSCFSVGRGEIGCLNSVMSLETWR